MVDAVVLAAAESHEEGAVLAWLDSGGFIDATFIWHGLPDMTLLGVAAATGGAGLVQSLLERGADVNLRNGRGRSALALSTHCFNPSILPSVPGAPPLPDHFLFSSAGDADYVAVVEVLLHCGAEVNLLDLKGNSALAGAALQGDLRMVDLLLTHGADCNLRCDRGRTALMAAALMGHEPIVVLLLGHGADPCPRDDLGYTALLYAAAGREDDGVERPASLVLPLLEAGADARVASRAGMTPLQVARERGHVECAAALRRHLTAEAAAAAAAEKAQAAAAAEVAAKAAAAWKAQMAEAEAEAERRDATLRAEAAAKAERCGAALLAEIEAEEEAEKRGKGKKGKKKKKKKGKGGGGKSQEPLAPEERRVAEEQPPQPEVPPREGEAPPREEEAPPPDFICPITTEVMIDPMMAADGHSYEGKQIERWLATKSTSPMTGEALEHSFLTPNHALRGRIREWQGQGARA